MKKIQDCIFFLTCIIFQVISQDIDSFVEFEAPCPLSWNPYPCECSGHSKARNLDCSLAKNSFELSQSFSSLFDGLPFVSFRLHQSNFTFISSVSFGSSNFTSFSIEEVPIKEIPDDFFKSSQNTVSKISISKTKIQEFPFGSLTNYPLLEVLVLSSNQLTFIPSNAFGYQGLPRLRELDISDNQITNIPSMAFAHLPYLERLDISKNNLTTLKSNSFSNPGMKDILMLYLTDNSISKIEKNAFADLSFSSIHLERNQLKKIPRDTFELLIDTLDEKDATLYLEENKFECNTTIQWLIEKPRSTKHHIKDFSCESGKTLETLTVNDLNSKL